jgi:ActR/RegA family two-component response regulator
MPSNETHHVLIIDDEEFILEALRIYFETQEYRVSVASDGIAALGIFRQVHPTLDAVILDLVLPGTHGLEILREMRAIDPGIQVIIATGCASLSSAVEALRLGACDYITKPIVDFDSDLMGAVKSAVGQRQRLRRMQRRAKSESTRALATGSHWVHAIRALNAFAGSTGAAAAGPRTMEQIGEIVSTAFAVDGAALLEYAHPGAWRILHAWTPREFSLSPESWSTVLVAALESSRADSRRFDVAVPLGLGSDRSDMDHETSGLDAIGRPFAVPVPLPVRVGERRLWLALYYEKAPDFLREKSPCVPLALLGSAVGPLLERWALAMRLEASAGMRANPIAI